MLAADKAYAYSCVLEYRRSVSAYRVFEEVGKALDAHRAVFFGEATTFTWTTVTFKVERVWKGELGAEFVMMTGRKPPPDGAIADSSHTFGLVAGEKYLVFADGRSLAELMAPECSWTKPRTHADQTIKLLDQLQKPLLDVTGGSGVYEELRLAALRFFHAVNQADEPALTDMTNPEARDRVRTDLRREWSRFSRILLTDYHAVRVRFGRIRDPRVVLLQHPDFVDQRVTACIVDSAAAFSVPRTIRDIPVVRDSENDICVPFVRAKDDWTLSYEFAFPDWDPPATAPVPPKARAPIGD